MSDAELAELAEHTTVFAKLSPAQKARDHRRAAAQAGTWSASWATASTTARR